MRRHFLVSGLFEVRVAEYLDSCPEPEPSGVNKFLKGLGRRRFTHVIHSQKCSILKSSWFFCFFLFVLFFQVTKWSSYKLSETKNVLDLNYKTLFQHRAAVGGEIVIVFKSSDMRKQGSSDIIAVHVHVRELHTLLDANWKQYFWLYFYRTLRTRYKNSIPDV